MLEVSVIGSADTTECVHPLVWCVSESWIYVI